MLINVDLDGVIIPNDFEKKFVLKGLDSGYTKISQFDGKLFDWYLEFINSSPLAPLNTGLLRWLDGLRSKGHLIRLWTNRNQELRNKTLRNLGEYKFIFDSFEFYSGTKQFSKVEGIAIDNSITNLSCAELGGIHYEWKGDNHESSI
jgi:hypothetical protein